MQIVRDLAGFSMGQSDNVRRAMSKEPDELAQYKSLFLHGGRDEKAIRFREPLPVVSVWTSPKITKMSWPCRLCL